MFLNLKKSLFIAGTSALLFSGCGDDGTVTPDATPLSPDAMATADAMPSTEFTGSIAIAEVSVSNPEAAQLGGVSGAGVVVSYTAPADAVAPHPDFPQPVNACKVTIIDVASDTKGSDGGPVSVTGTLAGDFGCAYNATVDKYLCSTTDSAAAGVMPATTTTLDVNPPGFPAGTILLTIPGADFSGLSYAGMSVTLLGFPGIEASDLLPITADSTTVGALADTQLLLANTLGLIDDATLPAAGGYQTLVGAGPIPGGYDFLDDGTADIAINKAAATDAAAIAVTLKANGQGVVLAEGDAFTSPHQFPATGPATYSCDPEDAATADNTPACGVEQVSGIQGLVVFGETTDVLTAAERAAFNKMPDPTTQYATFSCSAIGGKKMVIPAAAVALIMGTGASRIQTTVVYTNGQPGANVNVLAGHGQVGFTTVPLK